MDLAEIELFGTLMRVGTTVETARIMGLSQPAVSARLKRLESRVGFALFHRNGNRLEPSAEAQELYAETGAIFTAQTEIRSRIEGLRNHATRPVTVAATPALVEGYLAPRLAQAGYKGWTRSLRIWIGEPESDVRSGRADIGLQMAVPARAEFEAETLAGIALYAVLQAGHPLARRDVLELADLRDEPLVCYDPDWSPMGGVIRRAFRAQGLEYRLACQVPFCSTVCHMVAACGGVGVVDQLTVSTLSDPRVVMRPLPQIPPIPLIAFHRRGEPLRGRAQELLARLRKRSRGMDHNDNCDSNPPGPSAGRW